MTGKPNVKFNRTGEPKIIFQDANGVESGSQDNLNSDRVASNEAADARISKVRRSVH